MDEMKKPTLKFMTRQDFDEVKTKYHGTSDADKQTIKEAKPLDVLALQVVPGSGLKILNVKILNEETVLDSLVNGVF